MLKEQTYLVSKRIVAVIEVGLSSSKTGKSCKKTGLEARVATGLSNGLFFPSDAHLYDHSAFTY